jgi:hypothetical protein
MTIDNNSVVNNEFFNQFFRMSASGGLEINWQINNNNDVEDWRECCDELTQFFFNALASENPQLSLGSLFLRYNSQSLLAKQAVEAAEVINGKLTSMTQANREMQNTIQDVLQKTSDHFFNAADRHGWCQVAADLIDDLNNNLPSGYQIPIKPRKFTYEVTATISLPITHSGEIDSISSDEAENELSGWGLLEHMTKDELYDAVHLAIYSNNFDEEELMVRDIERA